MGAALVLRKILRRSDSGADDPQSSDEQRALQATLHPLLHLIYLSHIDRFA
jgi:hypothetical protein